MVDLHGAEGHCGAALWTPGSLRQKSSGNTVPRGRTIRIETIEFSLGAEMKHARWCAWLLTVGCARPPPAALDLHGPPPPATRAVSRLQGPLVQVLDVALAGASWEAAASGVGLEVRQGRVRVQVDLLPGSGGNTLHQGALDPLGAHVSSGGRHVQDVWAPPWALAALAALPGVQTVRPPAVALQTLGTNVTQGDLLAQGPAFRCPGHTGAGVDVAVIDTSFNNWTATRTAGELAPEAFAPTSGGNPHGTACAEIISDLAPGVRILPVRVASMADMDAFVQALPGGAVDVVSHSLVWTGGISFSDGAGAFCAMVQDAAAANVAWIQSAGNYAANRVHVGTIVDVDADGRHEFSPGDEMATFTAPAGFLRVDLDWDAYPTTDLNLDLTLWRHNGTDFVEVGTSTTVQDGTTVPFEVVFFNSAPAGTYGITVHRAGGETRAPRFRVAVFGAGANPALEYSSQGQSLFDPSHCPDAVTVGASLHSDFAAGLLAYDSSRGPTLDGRTKPDLVGPSGVRTFNYASFFGTSAATPHVAGAVALLAQALQVSGNAAAQLLLQDALPTSTPVPNNLWGAGRLQLAPARAGWECAGAGVTQSCTSACGSAGTQTCTTSCGFGACVPPAESCNGADDDCDGAPDNTFACVQDASTPCVTGCGSTGSQACDASCVPLACIPPLELCNGLDDDCDGAPDNSFACVQGSVVPCSTACGSAGTRSCSGACLPGVCEPPVEACNGLDDDCDGAQDNGFACVQGVSAVCLTGCGSVGSRPCSAACVAGACQPPVEICNGLDDDCDGAPDNGFTCIQGSVTTCLTSCGSTGAVSCGNTCAPGACVAPTETCNGMDDDCSGQPDDTFACVLGQTTPCQTTCGTAGTQTCGAGCSPGACVPPAETCNGADDNCDGRADEAFACAAGSSQPCTTQCGTAGTRSCDATCIPASCAPPAETCNGLDDNCDDQADEAFACAVGATTPCLSTCGTVGTSTCSGQCEPGACQPPPEVCNGLDDNCDGNRDETGCPDAGLPPQDGGQQDAGLQDAGAAADAATALDATPGQDASVAMLDAALPLPDASVALDGGAQLPDAASTPDAALQAPDASALGDAAPAQDGGLVRDAAVAGRDAAVGVADGALATADASSTPGDSPGGCSCRGNQESPGVTALLVLAFVLRVSRRRAVSPQA